MSAFRYPLEIGDPQGQRFERVDALVDTGATLTVVPASILERLGVDRLETRRFRLADGRTVERDIGETLARLDGATVHTAVIFGEDESEALVGVHTLERAFLSADPVNHRLVPTEGLLM